MLLNACGEVVHDWTVAEDRRPGNTAYLQENGDIIMTSRPASVGNDPIWAGGGGATIERRTWDNDVLWSFTANNDSLRLHHDFTVTPSGNVIAICWEVLDSLECIENGRDPSLLTGGELWSDKLIELQPDGMGGADIVWEWRAWDHLVQDFDSTKANFGVVADNQSLIDLNYGSLSNQPADWLHMNAVDYWPYTDVNQIVRAFQPSTKSGSSARGFSMGHHLPLGQSGAYDRGDTTHQRLFYQHDIHWGNGLESIRNPTSPSSSSSTTACPTWTRRHAQRSGDPVPLFDEYPEPGGSVYEFDFDNGRWGPEDFVDLHPTRPQQLGLSSYQPGNGGSLICRAAPASVRAHRVRTSRHWTPPWPAPRSNRAPNSSSTTSPSGLTLPATRPWTGRTCRPVRSSRSIPPCSRSAPQRFVRTPLPATARRARRLRGRMP